MGSDSGLARPEHGSRFLATAVADLAPLFAAFDAVPTAAGT
jgi:hypothetical protein